MFNVLGKNEGTDVWLFNGCLLVFFLFQFNFRKKLKMKDENSR